MKKRIKVLSVCTSDSIGGAARAAYRIHKAVQKCGIDSRMFVKDKGTQDEDVLALEQFLPTNPFYKVFDWVRTKVKNKWQHLIWRRYPRRTSFFMSDLRAEDIHGALDRFDYDILHLHWINLRFFPLDQLPKDKHIVWTLHDSWPFCGICHYFLDCNGYTSGCGHCPHLASDQENDLSRTVWKKKKKVYQSLDLHIVSPSRWLAECASKSLLFRDRSISVIPNCLDTDTFKPIAGAEICPELHELKESFNGKSIVLCGAVSVSSDKIKGLSLFIDALHYLVEKGYSDRIGVIVFGSEETIDTFPQGLSTYQMGYLDNTEKLVSLYNISSVVPSYTEVFGQVASEAMSCGKPVVAFRCTGIQEVVDEECGYLAAPFSTEDFAEGILWCLNNNQEGRLSANARNKVLNHYSPEVVGNLYSELYKELV